MEMINVWFGITASFLQMLLINLKQVSLEKFEEEKNIIIDKIEKLKQEVGKIKDETDKIYI